MNVITNLTPEQYENLRHITASVAQNGYTFSYFIDADVHVINIGTLSGECKCQFYGKTLNEVANKCWEWQNGKW